MIFSLADLFKSFDSEKFYGKTFLILDMAERIYTRWRLQIKSNQANALKSIIRIFEKRSELVMNNIKDSAMEKKFKYNKFDTFAKGN